MSKTIVSNHGDKHSELTKPNMSKLRQKLLNCAKHAHDQPNNTYANQTFARVSERAAKYGIQYEG